MLLFNFIRKGFLKKNDNQYEIITKPNLLELRKKYNSVWRDKSFPEKQWIRIEKQLADLKNIPEFKVAVSMIKAANLISPKILEIGCSSGYLSEVISKSGIIARYHGTDYSQEFIRFARQKYPKIPFAVNNATNLKYSRNNFDIVVSGGCILHIIDYKKAISEASRVAKRFVIFHRTPVLHAIPTTFLTKTAYGRKMMDIFFNEEELVNLFRKNNLAVVKVITLSEENVLSLKEKMIMKDYLCQKLI